MKVCSSCGKRFESDGYKTCKPCLERARRYRQMHLKEKQEYNYNYYHNNIERERKRSSDYKRANPEKVKESARALREATREKCNERNQKWRKENPEYWHERYLLKREHILKISSIWAKANVEKRRASGKRFRKAHRDKVHAWERRFRQANPDYYIIRNQNRRTHIKGNGGTLTRKDVKRLFVAQNYICPYCNKNLYIRFDDPPEIEHKVPLSRGGSNHISNICIAHASCNREKYTMTDEEYFDFLARNAK